MGPFISEGFSEGNFSHFSNACDLGDGDESTGFGSRGSITDFLAADKLKGFGYPRTAAQASAGLMH